MSPLQTVEFNGDHVQILHMTDAMTGRPSRAVFAKIYKPSKNAMQSGRAKTQDWVLEFVADAERSVEPLMGWTSSTATEQQVRLYFDTREEAVAYCEREAISYQVTTPREPRRIVKTYADNFAADRKRPWTH